MHKAIIAFFIAVFLLIGSLQPAQANDSYYQLGMTAYYENDYSTAKKYLQKYLDSVPTLKQEHPAFYAQVSNAIETCNKMVELKADPPKGPFIIEVETSMPNPNETDRLDIK